MGSLSTGEVMCSLFCVLLLAQCSQGSTVLDSLNCVNDYRTQWRCQWKESVAAHKLLPMKLYHWSNVNNARSLCVPSDIQKDESLYWNRTCHINSKFGLYVYDNFTFLPERPIEKKIHVIPAYKVRTHPPEGLQIHKLESGMFTLSWKMPVYPDLPLTLLYQISYHRRDWETWEDAASLNVLNELEVSLNPQLFVPGSTYLFRVRTSPQEGNNLRSSWSIWSEELAWNMPEEDAASPQNLQCEYNGLGKMRCTWEVREEVTLSVSYALYYKVQSTEAKNKTQAPTRNTTDAGDKECLPEKRSAKAGIPYVLYSCTIQVSPTQAHSSFYIQVRPREEVKTFMHSKTIQTPPPKNLTVEERLSRWHMLRWSPPNLANIRLVYQLCYWKQGDPECPDHLLFNVPGNLPEYYILGSELQGSTDYIARVRTKPDERQENYRGPWSEWSQSISWKTSRAYDKNIIFIVAATGFTGLLLACLFWGYKHIKRSKEKWDLSLPNPGKSKLFSNHHLGFWSPSFPTYFSNDDIAEKAEPSLCFEMSRKVDSQQPEDEEREECVEKAPKKNDCPLGPYAIAPPTVNKMQSQPFVETMKVGSGTSECTAMPLTISTEQPIKKCYNEPYLMFSRVNSISDLVGMKIKDPRYFTLPRCQAKDSSLPEKVTLSHHSVLSKDEIGYVLGMGVQQPHLPPQEQVRKTNNVQSDSYIPVPPPTDLQIPKDGTLMVITPDETGPLMLKQVGDYCFFPGLHGSQEKLAEKLVPPIENKEQHIQQDPHLQAVHAFKVMQRGYLVLPQT